MLISCENCVKMWRCDGTPGCAMGEWTMDPVGTAMECPSYAPADEPERYTPSASAGDYGPSCPWKAPGMSVSDFV